MGHSAKTMGRWRRQFLPAVRRFLAEHPHSAVTGKQLRAWLWLNYRGVYLRADHISALLRQCGYRGGHKKYHPVPAGEVTAVPAAITS